MWRKKTKRQTAVRKTQHRKTKYWARHTQPIPGCYLWFSGMISTSCFYCDTHNLLLDHYESPNIENVKITLGHNSGITQEIKTVEQSTTLQYVSSICESNILIYKRISSFHPKYLKFSLFLVRWPWPLIPKSKGFFNFPIS